MRARAVQAVLRQRVLLHQVEHHQRRDALRVRRQLVHGPAAVRRRNRIDPLGPELPQILGGHRAAELTRDREDGVGGFSVVEAGRAFLAPRGGASRRARGSGTSRPPAARGRRGRYSLAACSSAASFAADPAHPCGDDVGHRKAVRRVEDRRGQQVGHRQRAEPRAQRVPAGDGARHGHRVDAGARHRARPFDRSSAGVSPVGAQPPAFRPKSFFVLRLVDDREQVAADAVHLGLDEAHHGVGGNRGVDGVAAALEDLHAGARGQRLAGRDDAVTRRDLRASGSDCPGRCGTALGPQAGRQNPGKQGGNRGTILHGVSLPDLPETRPIVTRACRVSL